MVLAFAFDTEADVRDLLTGLASDLASENARSFMLKIDRGMEGYSGLEANVQAMVKAADVANSIEILDFNDKTGKVQVTLDWYLELRHREGAELLSTERRREQVKCSIEKRGKKWIVTKLEPLSFFEPPKATSR